MKDLFIPYKQALELKELRFNEPCFGRYDGKGNNKGKLWYEMPNSGQDTIPVGDILAPTFSQAFRWFREKYGLHHHIWSGKLNHIFYGYDILNVEKQEFVINNSDVGGGDCDYETYEEAEQACLRKLIEIVKNK
jgi:hypothetical protein